MKGKFALYFWSASFIVTLLVPASIFPVSGNTPDDPYRQYECARTCNYDLQIGDHFYPIIYRLVGEPSGASDSVKLVSITADPERKAIVTDIETTGFGTFRVSLPRYIIQSADETAETDFRVLVDGRQVEFDEHKNDEPPREPFRHRSLTIDFDKGTKKIEIIGTWMNNGKDFSDPDPYFQCGSLEQACTYVLQAAGNNKTMPLKYAIMGDEKTGDKEFPKVEKIYVYTVSDSHSLYFHVESPYQGGGHLVLQLPPEIVQLEGSSDFPVYDGETTFAMNHTNVIRKDARLLDIPFGKGSHEIEVYGISIFEEGEEVVPPTEFPCAINECIYKDLAGENGTTYDVRYHISGWKNFGYPENLRINNMSINHDSKSLLVNVTAEQSGNMAIILEDELIENELAGAEGINYIVNVRGERADTNWPGPHYYPDLEERVASFNLPPGASQVEIIGVPVDICDERIYSELEFCLFRVNLNGTLYPLLIKYSPDNQANASMSINNVSIDEKKKSVTFDLTTSHRSFVHFIPTKEMIDAEDYLTARVNGKIDSGSDNLEGQINVWFFVPSGSSKVELLGTWVTPEFGSSVATVLTAIALAGIVMAAKRFNFGKP